MSEATRVAIIGLGVIGGSAALRLRERGVHPRCFAASQTDRDTAQQAGLDVSDGLAAAVRDADLILVAVPLDALASVADAVCEHAADAATICHTAGLQRPDATRLAPAVHERVIGTHPLAGSADSGFAAARAELFAGSRVLVEPRGSAQAREDAELFWSMVGASRIEYLDAAEHDRLIAAISHVPQLVATALAAALSYASIDPAALGPGGRDMTRLAGSPLSMWEPLLRATPGRTLALLEAVESELRSMRESIARGDLHTPALTWQVARTWTLSGIRQ